MFLKHKVWKLKDCSFGETIPGWLPERKELWGETNRRNKKSLGSQTEIHNAVGALEC